MMLVSTILFGVATWFSYHNSMSPWLTISLAIGCDICVTLMICKFLSINQEEPSTDVP